MSFYLASLVFPQAIAVLISMVTTIYLTGAFHEDGLADSADGIGGGWGREQILTIMQDSRIGTYGAVALLYIVIKFEALNFLHPDIFVVINCWSCTESLMRCLDDGDGRICKLVVRQSRSLPKLASVIYSLPIFLDCCLW